MKSCIKGKPVFSVQNLCPQLMNRRALISGFLISVKIAKHFWVIVPHSCSCSLPCVVMFWPVHSISAPYSYFIYLASSCNFSSWQWRQLKSLLSLYLCPVHHERHIWHTFKKVSIEPEYAHCCNSFPFTLVLLNYFVV
jgi:hypothetical protein